MEISKELFTAVRGSFNKEIFELILKGNSIEINSFFFDCKEWAFNKGYELRSGRDIDVKEELCYFCEYKQERQLDYANGDYFLADNEPEAIIKACEWVLKELNEK